MYIKVETMDHEMSPQAFIPHEIFLVFTSLYKNYPYVPKLIINRMK